MAQLLTILGVVLLSAAFTPPGAKGQEAAKTFGKTLPDGSAVRLIETTITEFRSRPRSANPDAPEQELYSDREWKIVTYTLLLKRPQAEREEVLWRTTMQYTVKDKQTFYRIGQLNVTDALVAGDKAYVLYSAEGLMSVDNVAKGGDGEWDISSTTPLARSTDTSPIFKAEFLPGRQPRIGVDYLGTRGKDYQKVLTWVFTLADGKWKRK